MHKILILEDDSLLRAETAEALEDNAFDVRQAGTVAAFWPEFRSRKPDLVVLDMHLPDGRGRDVVREVRAAGTTGILVLSGQRDEADRVIALEMGADDFLTKPCGPRELVARINAILRRTDVSLTTPQGDARRIASFAGCSLDLAAMELRDAAGQVCPLTTAEFNLLRVFVERPQRVLSRDQLLDLMRGENWSGYDRTIDGLVSRLRKKLPGGGDGSQVLKTVHGAGYMFTPPVN